MRISPITKCFWIKICFLGLVVSSPLTQISSHAASSSDSQVPTPNLSKLTQTQPAPNSVEVPKQILKTGVLLRAKGISANSRQLADSIGLLPVLEKIQTIRASGLQPESLSTSDMAKLSVLEMEGIEILQQVNFAIDFVLAEISAEENLYASILATYANDRDRAVLKTNAVSFLTNGALWAVAEGLDVPTYRRPNLSISSGTTGVLAGIVPSIASAYALYQLNGKKSESESDPNMLAKLFDYPTNPEIEYPQPVWDFLNSVPAEDGVGQSRRIQLIDRWVADKNIPNFTDKSSKVQLDIITASVARRKGLSIATLGTRQTMLQQLGSEILKMKRLLFELSMALRGEKSV